MAKNLWWSDDAMYLVKRIHPNLALQAQGDGSWLSRRAMNPRHVARILDMWPGDAIDLFSVDSLCNAETGTRPCSVEFLQKQCISGVPDHHL